MTVYRLTEDDDETVWDVVYRGNVGDIIKYSPNNQQGYAEYEIVMDSNGEKSAKQIGDIDGPFDMEGGRKRRKGKKSRKTKKTKKGGKKSRKIGKRSRKTRRRTHRK